MSFEREASVRSQRSADPGFQRTGTTGTTDTTGSTRQDRSHRDRSHRRERQRSSSPSGARGSHRQKTGTHRTRRARKGSAAGTGNEATSEMAWSRSAKSPARKASSSRGDVAMRQLDQVAQKRVSIDDEFDALAASHQGAHLRREIDPSPFEITEDTIARKRASSSKAAVASSNDVDAIIAQFRDQCDVHMATLLELKNNITTTEKEVVVNTEKEKEFQQVRQWYSSLAEKHTKLQKEHQALQEDHMKLQQRYMNLKRASGLNDSFVAHFGGTDGGEEKQKKKDKKDKGIGEIVWSRAVKPTGKAAGKMAGNVAGKVKNKMHSKLKEEE